MRTPLGGCDEETDSAHPPEASTRSQIVCRKCQAAVADSTTSKFCDQCGHRLRGKRRVQGQANRKSRHQIKGDLSGTSSPVSDVNGDGWFWGTHDVPQLPTLQDVKDVCTLPLKYPLIKAHTATGGSGHSHALDPPVRRTSSFENPSSLPTLSPVLSRERLAGESAVRVQSSNKATADLTHDSSSSNRCGVLWGGVLVEAIAEFESRRIILTVEIDADERCMCVLAQKLQVEEAARSKYVVASGISQLLYKHNELDKKIRINKDKLLMVQQRLTVLLAQREREEARDTGAEPERSESETPAHSNPNQDNQCESGDDSKQDGPAAKKKTKNKMKKHKTAIKAKQVSDVEAAAVFIQKRFRVLRARRLFVDTAKRAYQRVLDPDTKRYFYYNPQTQQSQWDIPPALARANLTMAQRRPRREASAQSLTIAASRIQALYRRRAARRTLRTLLAQVYEKVYDAESNSYYYSIVDLIGDGRHRVFTP